MLNYPLRSSSMRLSIAACKKVARPVVSTAATLRGYHTYPDPDEAPIISTARSDAKNGTSKTGEEFRSMSLRYDINKAFGIPKDMRAIPLTKQPRTEITKLANGLTIATQDMPGMMCSMALLVKTGRYQNSFEVINI